MPIPACDLTIESFEFNECDNTPAGIHWEIKGTFVKWLDPIPAQDDYPTTGLPLNISSDITLDTVTHTTATWATWQGVPNKSSFESEASGDPGAIGIASFVEFFVPGAYEQFSWILSKSLNRPMMFMYRYNNNKWRTLGSPDFPAFLTYKEATGKAAGDEIGYTVRIEVGVHSTAFPWYSGTVPS